MTAIRTSTGREPHPLPGKWQAAALYALLTILLAFPLSVTADRRLPAAGADDLLFMWTLAWNTHALATQPLSIFDANIFYPNTNTLAYSENLIGSTFFAAPVLWLTGNPVLAVNVVSLLSCVLCGLGAYVLGRRVGLSATAAVLAGLIFAFSPARFLRFSQIHLTDAPICQDSRSRSQVCGLARSVVCHHALKNLAGEKAFETADDLPFGPPFSGASFDVVEGW